VGRATDRLPATSTEPDHRVALVTGASQGIGKGIGVELAANGVTVYITARTRVDDVAKEISAGGGACVPMRCDHSDDAQVRAVFDAIRRDEGRIDVLVNNASPSFTAMVGKPFWEIDFDDMTRCMEIGPRSNFVATALAAPMMVTQESGLVVNVSSHGAEEFLLSVPYCAGKAAIDKITRDTALELYDHHVAVVSLWPGLVRSERLVARAEKTPDGRMLVEGLDLALSESPEFSGRAVVSLMNDPDVMSRSGGSYHCTELAELYGFTDIDGVMPPTVRNLSDHLGEGNVPSHWRVIEKTHLERLPRTH
jgi:NAD(P)-dependent dehydrogenase (short-subunit alcohol dehydrogenase family)